jgi:short-subunit dehydrogenase
MAARHSARGLVLVARSEDALRQLEREINGMGPTRAVAVACDVADSVGLHHAAVVARERFGGFDTWVNNAGVGLYGRIMEVSDEDNRRLFETNFWGAVNGSRIAIEHLRTTGGTLINIGSAVSERSIPLQGMYSSTKHALKAFTDALRMELEEERAPINVTLIKPASIATPYPEHARNYFQDEPTLPPPVYAPELVAESILHACETPVRDLFVGGAAKQFQMGEHYAPRGTDIAMEHLLFDQMHSGKPRQSEHDGLHTANHDLRERGNIDRMVRENSVYTAMNLHPSLSLLGLLGIGAAIGLGATLMSRSSGGHTTRVADRETYSIL